MTLAFNAAIITGTTMVDAVSRPGVDEIVTLHSTGMQRYNLATLATIIGTSGAPAGMTSLCMMSSNVAAFMSNGVASTNFTCVLDITTFTNVVQGGRDSTPNTGLKPQQMAGDLNNNRAVGLARTSGTVIEFNTSGSVVNTGCDWLVNPTTIVSYGSGRYLIGTASGQILEVAVNSTIGLPMTLVRSYTLAAPKQTWKFKTAAPNQSIYSMHLLDSPGVSSAQLLLVSCLDGHIYLINHKTGTTLQKIRVTNSPSGATQTGPLLSADNGRSVLMVQSNAQSASQAFPLVELDMIKTPVQQKSFIYAPSLANPKYRAAGSAGVVPSGHMWAITDTVLMSYLNNIDPSYSVGSQAFNVSSNSDLVMIDDTGGAGNAKMIFHTDLAPPTQDVYIPGSLSSVLFAASQGSGTDELFDIRRNAT